MKKRRKCMKKLSKILLFLVLLVCIAGINQARATLLNLTGVTVDGVPPEDSGIINGALFERLDISKAGRGVFPTFLNVQQDPAKDGITQGYNSDWRPVEFQEGTSGPHNHSVELGWLGQIQLDSVWYYSFALDVDQAPGDDPYLFLEKLQIFQTDDNEAHPYSALGNTIGTKVYDLDVGADGDSTVLLDYLLSSGGSGQSDMIVNIPTSNFVYPGDYVVLYCYFTNDNDGPQEWSYMAGPGAPVPEPATMLLLGSGLLGLAGLRRKFRK